MAEKRQLRSVVIMTHCINDQCCILETVMECGIFDTVGMYSVVYFTLFIWTVWYGYNDM